MAGVLVAVIQMSSGSDKAANLAVATELVEEAAGRGSRLVVLPEMFNNLGGSSVLRAGAEPFDGPTSRFAKGQASRLGIWILAGSFIELDTDGSRRNTSVLASPAGEIVAVYRKVHLFDVSVPGAEFRESDVTRPGDELVVADVDGVGAVGFSLCYDIRFPEQCRILALRGAKVMAVPAAFTAKTGPAHWELLLRARAVENQVWVVAAGQHGVTSTERGEGSRSSLAWHGHSMIVDPWGTVVAQASDGDAVVVAEIDQAYTEHVRDILPSLAHRRPTVYDWPANPQR